MGRLLARRSIIVFALPIVSLTFASFAGVAPSHSLAPAHKAASAPKVAATNDNEGDLVTSPEMSNAITAVGDFTDSADAPAGFANMTQTGPTSLLVRWKGNSPDALSSILAKNYPDLTVTFEPADFSADEIDAEIHVLMKLAISNEVTINTIAPKTDYSGIDVGLAPNSFDIGQQVLKSDVPLSFTKQTGGVEPTSGRRADTPLFWGSSAIRNMDFTCTSAFPIVRTGGQEGLLTARHCGTSMTYTTWQGNTFVGNAGTGDVSTDSVVISGAEYGHYVYDGAWNSDDRAGMTGSGNPAIGQGVCFDGSFEGRHCTDVRVYNTDAYANLDGTGLKGPGFWADRYSPSGNKESIMGSGDSGSPVFDWSNDAHTMVNIRGMAIGVSPNEFFDTGCDGSPDIPRICSTTVFSINIEALKKQVGFTLSK